MRKTILSIVSVLLFAFVLVPSASAATTSSIFPTADGTYSQFTPKSGSVHYTHVDDNPCDANSTHNRTTVVGERDSYVVSLSSVPNGATITQIAITPCASRNNSGSTDPVMDVFYRLNGVNSANSGSYVLNSGTTPSLLGTTTYPGLSSSKSGATTLEIGAVLTSGTRGVKLSNISTVITYTIPAPTVTTNSATSVGTNTATLNSTVNPNGFSTTVNYRYGLSNIACASLTSSTSGTVIGSGTSNVSPNARVVSPLSASTTYYYCALGTNSGGTTYGDVLSFTTLALPTAPTVTTNDATNLVTVGSSASADLNSTVNPNGASTTVRYRYSTTNNTCSALGVQTSSTNIGSGYIDVSPNTRSVGFLPANTTVYFCAVATNSVGTTYGDVLSFTTLP